MYLLDQPDAALAYRRQYRGLIGIVSKVPLRDRAMLSLVYTPGVAEACRVISHDEVSSFDLTGRGNTVAIMTDASDLFDPTRAPVEAALPLLEGKAVLFKTFAGVDAVPISIDLSDPLEFIEIARSLIPTFGAICLDHIRAPHSFTIQDHLEKAAPIPVFSNQHHGTAILVLGALKNALEVVGKRLDQVRVVIAGAGLAGIGVARLLTRVGVRDLIVCDRAGAIHQGRPHRMNWAKAYLAKETNPERRRGPLSEVLQGADVFIGLARGNIVTPEMIASMAPDPIVFALALPIPEIDPVLAKQAGAAVVATGRSDYSNMMDVSLVFPGVFRGLLDSGARNIRLRTLVYAAEALASLVPAEQRSPEHIVPQIFDFRVAPAIAAAVVQAALETGEATRAVDPQQVAENTRRYIYEGAFEPPRPVNRRPRSLAEQALDLRRRYRGILEIHSKLPVRDDQILNLLYLPPAALAPVEEVRRHRQAVFDLTVKGNLVAIVTDGSAVLGLGDIGPQAALPVMEGKAVLFQSLGGVEAFPICIAERDPGRIVDIVVAIAPSFGGINLEDISAPRCFEIEAELKERLDMPVFHDDQHGTAIVVLAALLNALRLRGTPLAEARVVINGAGAAGIATAKLLLVYGAGDIVLCDRHGAIFREREVGMNRYKMEIARLTNKSGLRGPLADVLKGAEVFIGLSSPNILAPEMIRAMAADPIVFALANPDPEIHPDLALEAGALVVATGRSDFPNQVNNSLAFPGVFRGALDVRARDINDAMKVAAAQAIADLVPERQLSPQYIIPDSLDLRVPPAVAAAVARAALETGVAQVHVDPEDIAARTEQLLYEGSRR